MKPLNWKGFVLALLLGAGGLPSYACTQPQITNEPIDIVITEVCEATVQVYSLNGLGLVYSATVPFPSNSQWNLSFVRKSDSKLAPFKFDTVSFVINGTNDGIFGQGQTDKFGPYLTMKDYRLCKLIRFPLSAALPVERLGNGATVMVITAAELASYGLERGDLCTANIEGDRGEGHCIITNIRINDQTLGKKLKSIKVPCAK